MSAREEIREWENQCNGCKKRKGKAASQVMGPLPKVRLRFSMRAFAQTAVDYGGPFITIQGRGKTRLKRWQRVQEHISHFWRRWLKEWLPGQNVRKWEMLCSPYPVTCHEPTGRSAESAKFPKGRTIMFQVGQNSLLRPINKLIHLDVV